MKTSTTRACSRPWHFILQAEPKSDDREGERKGWVTRRISVTDECRFFFMTKGKKYTTHWQKHRGPRASPLGGSQLLVWKVQYVDYLLNGAEEKKKRFAGLFPSRTTEVHKDGKN